MVDRFGHAAGKRFGIAELPQVRAAEDRDLARGRGAIRTVRRARHARVQPEQTGRPNRRELVGGRLVLDHDGHATELVAERVWQRIDGRDHEFVERIGAIVGGLDRIGRQGWLGGLGRPDLGGGICFGWHEPIIGAPAGAGCAMGTVGLPRGPSRPYMQRSVVMTTSPETYHRQVLMRRSAAQLLDRRVAGGPVAAVRALLAVQAQDRGAWRLALRARVEGITAADVNRALTDDRSLLVAWLNRGTLHLVCREDYAWLWALAAPTQKASNMRRLAQEGLSPDDVDRGVACIERSLATDGPLHRGQLRDRMAARGIRTEGQATVQLLFAAVGRGVAVLGPVLDGEHAFAHTREWLGAEPRPAPLVGERREVALAELARRYLRGHGPATDRDLAKWAGLPLRDARAGLRAVSSELVELEGGLVDLADRRPSAFELEARSKEQLPSRLLPAFDPCLLAWQVREPFLRRLDEPRVIPVGGGLFRPVATVDGVAAATWGIRRQGERVAIRIDPFEPLDAAAGAALEAEVADVARFEGRQLAG